MPERQDESVSADESAWVQADRRVVLATDSPFVHSFFQGIASEQAGSLAVHPLSLGSSGLQDHARYLSEASVAVVQTDPDLLVAEALCAALGVAWPMLPIIALVL